MTMSKDRRIVLVTRHTRVDELVVRHNTLAQARFVIESQGLAFADYLAEDRVFKAQLGRLKGELSQVSKFHHIDRSLLPAYLFRENDVVLVLGQDGLVANALKYLDGQPLIAVNPDPVRYDGILLPFVADDVLPVVQEVLKDGRKTQAITFGEAQLNDGQRLLAVNDLFIGVRGHTSARYEIGLGGKRERQSSSGIIVSTGLGSTGWFKSVLTGAVGIAKAMGYSTPKRTPGKDMRWDSEFLLYSVREPFPSSYTGTELTFGRVGRQDQLEITSNMPVDGVIFSDGMERDYLEFNSGRIAKIGLATKVGCLVL